VKVGIVLLSIFSLIAFVRVVWQETMVKDSRFELKRIAVDPGDGLLSRDDVVKLTGLKLGDSTITLNLRQLKGKLESIPEIENVQLEKDTKGMVKIVVKQRKPVAWVECVSQGLVPGSLKRSLLVDQSGVLFHYVNNQQGLEELPTISVKKLSTTEVGTHVMDAEMKCALRMIEFMGIVMAEEMNPLKRIEVVNSYALMATFADHMQVVVSQHHLEGELVKFQRIMLEASRLKWYISKINLIPNVNVPIVFAKKSVPLHQSENELVKIKI
jgi:POTRA domain, FtsQ-type